MELLIELERALHRHEVRTDLQQLVQLLHPEFREIGYSGNTYDFDTICQTLTDSRPEHTLHAQDFESVQLNEGAVLLLYKSVHCYPDGQYRHYSKRVSVWLKSTGQWQMRYHQGTPCDAFEIKTATDDLR